MLTLYGHLIVYDALDLRLDASETEVTVRSVSHYRGGGEGSGVACVHVGYESLL